MAKHSNILPLKALFSTFLIQVAASASMVALATVAPLAAADLHVPASMIGTYLAILYVGAAISSVSGGNLVRRYGGIHVSQAALLLAAAGLMLGCAPYLALVAIAAFMVVADDTERDYGNAEKAAKLAQTWTDNGWVVISEKNDWLTIYGYDVVKTSGEETAEAACSCGCSGNCGCCK